MAGDGDGGGGPLSLLMVCEVMDADVALDEEIRRRAGEMCIRLPRHVPALVMTADGIGGILALVHDGR